jgi:hypothetical protein
MSRTVAALPQKSLLLLTFEATPSCCTQTNGVVVKVGSRTAGWSGCGLWAGV